MTSKEAALILRRIMKEGEFSATALPFLEGAATALEAEAALPPQPKPYTAGVFLVG
jgi:hypothetical protein